MSFTTASCIIIIRATQKNRMSCPVTRTEVGKYFCSSGVFPASPACRWARGRRRTRCRGRRGRARPDRPAGRILPVTAYRQRPGQRPSPRTVGHLDDRAWFSGCGQVGLSRNALGHSLERRRAMHRLALDIAAIPRTQQDFHLVQRPSPSSSAKPGAQVQPIPHRNLMPPPQLAADAPGLDVLQPVVIGLLARGPG
jgi:hypothetical protein